MTVKGHVVLLGLMGSGKTSVGEPLARRLGRSYVDNDDELTRRTGRTARAIAEQDGIDSLHAAEADAFLAMLAAEEPAVLGGAASVVESVVVRDRLADHTVVWLNRDIATLAGKLRDKPHRPYPDEDPALLLTRQLEQRGPLFSEVAALVIDQGDRSDEELADEIAARLQ